MTTYPPRCERAQLTCVFLQNAPSHGAAPPSGWEGANFDDSAWPQATTFGQNAQQDGEPNVPIWRHVNIANIADTAHSKMTIFLDLLADLSTPLTIW